MPRDRTTPPTLSDVAHEAGVSVATASRTLNGSTRKVKDHNRERVLMASAKLGYMPNHSAQAVARGASNTAALLISDITDPSFSAISAGVLRAAEAKGILVTIAVTNRSSEREIELVRLLRGQRPRVLIVAGSRFVDDPESSILSAELEGYRRTGGRVVMISQNQLPFDTVLLDNLAGSQALAHGLVDHGYRRFAVLCGPENLATARDRLRGFSLELMRSGITIKPKHIVPGPFTRSGGSEAMMTLRDVGIDDIDLVFVVSDAMAMGALADLNAQRIRVPEQIAIAGYDDISTSREVSPTLTTVRVPLEEAGERAIALALRDHGHDTDDKVVETIPVTIVLRESTPRR